MEKLGLKLSQLPTKLKLKLKLSLAIFDKYSFVTKSDKYALKKMFVSI